MKLKRGRACGKIGAIKIGPCLPFCPPLILPSREFCAKSIFFFKLSGVRWILDLFFIKIIPNHQGSDKIYEKVKILGWCQKWKSDFNENRDSYLF